MKPHLCQEKWSHYEVAGSPLKFSQHLIVWRSLCKQQLWFTIDNIQFEATSLTLILPEQPRSSEDEETYDMKPHLCHEKWSHYEVAGSPLKFNQHLIVWRSLCKQQLWFTIDNIQFEATSLTLFLPEQPRSSKGPSFFLSFFTKNTSSVVLFVFLQGHFWTILFTKGNTGLGKGHH